jgi:hypothetical protein
MSSAEMLERSAIPRKMPPARANSAAGVSNSATAPASSTQMRSYAMIVRSRCAMHRIVRSANACAIVSWIFRSVS